MKILYGRGQHLILYLPPLFVIPFVPHSYPCFLLARWQQRKNNFSLICPPLKSGVPHMQDGSGSTVLLGRAVVFLDLRYVFKRMFVVACESVVITSAEQAPATSRSNLPCFPLWPLDCTCQCLNIDNCLGTNNFT